MHFLFKLCLQFHIPHPSHIKRTLTSQEVFDWWLYYQCDPWGDMREDYRAFIASRGMWIEDAVPEWPYYEQPMTEDEYREAMSNG